MEMVLWINGLNIFCCDKFCWIYTHNGFSTDSYMFEGFVCKTIDVQISEG